LVFAILSADTKRRDGLSMAEREAPPGGKAWLRRARGLQRDLIDRWAGLYA
jgi:D-alanyl-D-alanine carboxypeptidase/D-alanyl-D-alanine-endopeptidase (penicillin-binding protein 4)